MKHYITMLSLALLLLIGFCLKSQAITMHSYITVKTSGARDVKVYASTSLEENPNINNFKDSGSEFTLNLGSATFSKEATIYIYSYCENESYILSSWTGNDYKKNAPSPINLSTPQISCASAYVFGRGAKTSNCTFAFTANYEKVSMATISYNTADFGNSPAPTISIDNPKNKIGNTITIAAEGPAIYNGSDVKNPHFSFSHWEKSDGTFVTYENPYTFTVNEEAEYVARFNFNPMFHGKGYYRIRSCTPGSSQYLKAVGSNDYASTDFSVHDHVDVNPIWTLTDYYKDETGASVDSFRYDDPGTIFYYDNTRSLDVNTFNNISKFSAFSLHTNDVGQAIGNKGDVLKCQGLEYLTVNILTGNYTLSLYAGLYPGSVAIRSPRATEYQFLTRLEDSYSMQFQKDVRTLYSTFELEPVDIEGGEYYFGAMPDEKSMYDGNYYTTMYTAFPYKCLGGVEAYYLKFKEPTETDPTYYTLEHIDGDIVPPYTPVVLKCLEIAPGNNRLIPLDPNGSYTAVTDNLLKGVIQLNKGVKDDPAQYQFNVSWADNSDYTTVKEGEYIFMITEEDPNDTEEPWMKPQRISQKWLPDSLLSEVCPSNFVKVEVGSKMPTNAAYLDVNEIASKLGKSLDDFPEMLSVIPGKIPTGIRNIAEDAKVDDAWYTLSGVAVDRPRKGEIYIHHRKKVIF